VHAAERRQPLDDAHVAAQLGRHQHGGVALGDGRAADAAALLGLAALDHDADAGLVREPLAQDGEQRLRPLGRYQADESGHASDERPSGLRRACPKVGGWTDVRR
jgi:hypothetical protein